MRRLVTGINADGKSVFVHDGPSPQPITGAGFELGALWASAPGTRLGESGTDAAIAKTSTVPQPGATVFTYVVIPPDGAANRHDDGGVSASADFHVEDDGRMHRTDTIDYGVLLKGELWLELDDGREQLLKAGDCFVQNGTRHAWHNRGSGPAVMCVAMIGMAREA
jgi:mannose-6-phosphate isomerase-like protein (cupin superfamily)